MAKRKKASKSQWKGVKDCRNSSSHAETALPLRILANNLVESDLSKILREPLKSIKGKQSRKISKNTANEKQRQTMKTRGKRSELKASRTTTNNTPRLTPTPLKRSKETPLSKQTYLDELPLSVNRSIQSRKTRSKTTASDTQKLTPVPIVPSTRSKRTAAGKQSRLEELPLSVSLETPSAHLKTRGRPSRKTSSETPRTTRSNTPNLSPVPLKRVKSTSLDKKGRLDELPLSMSLVVSSQYQKTRGRPSRKTTSEIAGNTLSEQSTLDELPLSCSVGDLSTHMKTRGSQSRKIKDQIAKKGTIETPTISSAPVRRSARISTQNQKNLKEPSFSLSCRASKSIKIRSNQSLGSSSEIKLHTEIKISKKTKRETRKNIQTSKKFETKQDNLKQSSLKVSLGSLSKSRQVRENQSRKAITETANKTSRKAKGETPSIIVVPLKRSKRIALSNQIKLSNSLPASSTFIKTRGHRSCKTDTFTAGIGISGGQEIQKTTKCQTSRRKNKTKKTTEVGKTNQNKMQNLLPSRSPIHVNFEVCDEISISQHKILKTKTGKPIIATPENASYDSIFKFPAIRIKNAPMTNVRPRRNSIRVSSLEPLILKRNTPISKDRSDIQLAKQSLHVSAVQETLICRETELKEIYKVIECKILESSGGCMYVCGVPGTGKTATIALVIKSLQLQTEAKNLPEFQFIQINGMRLTEPEQAYVHIYHQLTGVTVSWEQAHSFLETLFNASSLDRKIIVLVVDEFDMMKSRRERVIFNLLDWTTKKTAQLFLVAIGNIINPSQVITSALTSRLGSTRFTFHPYTHKELQKIVQARLIGINIFDKEAIQLVAKKVASISGDCRRALDICRRAAEIGGKDCAGKDILISTSHVCKAFDEMIINPKVIAIKACSKYEKLFLQAVAAEVARTGVDETVLFQVYRQLETICALNSVAVPDPGIALRLSSRLGSSRLLICEHSCTSIHQKIMLNVTEGEMSYAYDVNKND